MDDESKAERLLSATQKYEQEDPKKAIRMLSEIVRDYQRTYTVHNYVVPNILRISIQNKSWEEAINVCKVAINLYPSERTWWQLQLESCEYLQNGLVVESLETELKKETIRGKYYQIYCIFGDKFADIGKHDRAWNLYNEAILLAAKEKCSPHKVRLSMAKLLMKEGKYISAAETIIFGICESEALNKNGPPSSMVVELKRALKKAGIENLNFADQLNITCKTKGREVALKVLHNQIDKVTPF